MFDRFTPESRAVVKAATETAYSLDHDQVHTGHLLFGLLTEGGWIALVLTGLGLDARSLRVELRQARSLSLGGRHLDPEALAAIGVDYEAIRTAAEATFGTGALRATVVRKAPRRSWWRRRTRSTRLSGESRRALERSLWIAKASEDPDLGPRHLLLGVLADPFSVAARMISRHGLTADQIRAALRASEGEI